MQYSAQVRLVANILYVPMLGVVIYSTQLVNNVISIDTKQHPNTDTLSYKNLYITYMSH